MTMWFQDLRLEVEAEEEGSGPPTHFCRGAAVKINGPAYQLLIFRDPLTSENMLPHDLSL